MTRLADTVDGVIGVDTHRDTLAAATDRVGGSLGPTSAAAGLGGYQRLLQFAQAQVPGRRCWAVEGGRQRRRWAGRLPAGPGRGVVEIGRPKRQIARCARPRQRPTRSLELRMTARVLRSTAQRIQLLAAEAAELRAELDRLVAASAPWLLTLPGVGSISAAQVLVSWSHPGRLRSEAALLPWPAPTPSRRRRGRSPGIG